VRVNGTVSRLIVQKRWPRKFERADKWFLPEDGEYDAYCARANSWGSVAKIKKRAFWASLNRGFPPIFLIKSGFLQQSLGLHVQPIEPAHVLHGVNAVQDDGVNAVQDDGVNQGSIMGQLWVNYGSIMDRIYATKKRFKSTDIPQIAALARNKLPQPTGFGNLGSPMALWIGVGAGQRRAASQKTSRLPSSRHASPLVCSERMAIEHITPPMLWAEAAVRRSSAGCLKWTRLLGPTAKLEIGRFV
jgi:hypothetical protein